MEDWKNFKILVVEDNKINLLSINKVLSETNIQITKAINGKKQGCSYNRQFKLGQYY